MKVRAYVALGANLGDPVVTVKAAIAALRDVPDARLVAISSLYRTAPVGLKHQPDFINAVAALEVDGGDSAVIPATEGSPCGAPTFLAQLFAIEARFGRQRSVPNAPRTLDLDLLLFGDTESSDPACALPHPRMHQRAFVLAPLMEIAPQLVIPGRGRVDELLENCADQVIDRLTV